LSTPLVAVCAGNRIRCASRPEAIAARPVGRAPARGLAGPAGALITHRGAGGVLGGDPPVDLGPQPALRWVLRRVLAR
jgi:hypothetical protein